MEELFRNNIFFIYLLACIAIFNYEVFNKRQRILLMYLLSYGLVLLNIVGAKQVLILVTVVMFLYEEYLNTDTGKIELITNLKYKIIDFIYYAIFQYSIIWMYIAIILNCSFLTSKNPAMKYISFIFLIVGIQKLNNAKFELNSFTYMKRKFEEYVYKNINFANDDLTEKLMLLCDIEDRSFFDREKSYNWFSIEFIKYKLNKSTLYIENQNGYVRNKAIIKRGMQILAKDMKEGLILRGYSTIEMQLIKNIGIKRGFLRRKHLVARKIYELIYTKIFFSGLQQYYESNRYGKKEYFKKFIAYVYLHNVPTTINGRRYSKFVEAFNGQKIEEVSMNAMFVACLGLNTRNIYQERVELYKWMFERHGLDINIILDMAETKQLV